MKGRRTAWLPAAMMAFLNDHLLAAGLVLAGAGGFFHFEVVAPTKLP
jgi:hypothetical protein